MSDTGPALSITEHIIGMSALPPSVNGSLALYAISLASVMCICAICGSILFWMARDAWRDRKAVKVNTILFNFRLLFALIGTAGVVRTIPEVLYLQMYGDPSVSIATQATIMMAKRIADSTTSLFVAAWSGLLVMIYPFVCRALTVQRGGEVIEYLVVEDYPSIKRLARPFICFLLIVLVALAFAFGKVYHT